MKLYSVITPGSQFNVRAEGPLAAIARAAHYHQKRGRQLPAVTVVHNLDDLDAPSYYPAADMPTIGCA